MIISNQFFKLSKFLWTYKNESLKQQIQVFCTLQALTQKGTIFMHSFTWSINTALDSWIHEFVESIINVNSSLASLDNIGKTCSNLFVTSNKKYKSKFTMWNWNLLFQTFHYLKKLPR